MDELEVLGQNIGMKLAGKADDEIREAIRCVTGENEIPIRDVKRYGKVTVMPDGSEVFSYDGVDLIRFFPLEVRTVQDGIAFKTIATRRIEKLI